LQLQAGPRRVRYRIATIDKREQYRARLRELDEWEPFLQCECGLPGPRANLELVQAAADEGDVERFRRWLAIDADAAPSNSPREFLPLCGAVGLGRLIAEGHDDLLGDLRAHASDRRWRTREGVAMGLQRVGARDMRKLLSVAREWRTGTWLERRAVVAALCEPALLRDAEVTRAVLDVLDGITGSVQSAPERGADVRVLRQALGYGWSVALAAAPAAGAAAFERWLDSSDPDIRWIVRENLKKDRLKKKMDAAWLDRAQRLAHR
jgi:hypothetical protein